MKKLGMLSLVAAAMLLLSGCDHKSATSNEQKASAAQEAAKAAPKVETKEAPKVKAEQKVEAGDQAPAQKSAQEAAQSAQEAASNTQEQAQAKVKEVTQEAAKAAQAAKSEVQNKIDGAKLFARCASCHGPKGERHALGKSGIIAGMSKDEILKKLKGYKAGTLNQYGMGSLMRGQVASLSDAELEALADYISKVK